MKTALQPSYDRIVVRTIKGDAVTKQGLHLPESARKNQTGDGIMAEVVAVGPGYINTETGQLTRLRCEVGDTVILSEYAGTDVKIEGDALLIIKEADILCYVVKPGGGEGA